MACLPANARHGSCQVHRPAPPPARYQPDQPDPPAIWIDLASFQKRIPVQADEFGWAEVPFPLELNTSGDQYVFQFLFIDSPRCQGPTPECTTGGLEIQVP